MLRNSFWIYIKGSYYEIQIWHDELDKTQVIKSANRNDLQSKANSKMKQWDEQWERKRIAEVKRLEREQLARKRNEKVKIIEQNNLIATKRTIESQELLRSMEKILNYSLSVDDTIYWETTTISRKYKIPKPELHTKPKQPVYQEIPQEIPEVVDITKIIPENIPVVPIQPTFKKMPSKPRKPLFKDL